MANLRHVASVAVAALAAVVVGCACAQIVSVFTAATVPSPGRSCMRRCEEHDTRTCSFVFKVHLYQTLSRACQDCPTNSSHCSLPHCIPGNGIIRLVTVVDRQLPGPAIHVCEGDEVHIDVHNALPSGGVSLHWHGLRSSLHMDGTPGVTQHLLQPRGSFQYRLHASTAGTHYWHAMAGFQSGDGEFGPLIVHRPKAAEPHGELYDYDLPEHVILVHDWSPLPTEERFTLYYNSGADYFPDDLLVNGRGRYTRERSTPNSRKAPYAQFTVREGERYRFRIISAAFANCPVVVSVARHAFTVIATDGSPVVPHNATRLVLHPGERWDVVLLANQPPDAVYWMNFEGLLDCSPYKASQKAVLRYIPKGSRVMGSLRDKDGWEDVPVDGGFNGEQTEVNPISGECSSAATCLPFLRSVSPLPSALTDAAMTLYFSFSLRHLNHPDFYDSQLYPIARENEADRVLSPQINNITYRPSASPLLLLPSGPLSGAVCNDLTTGHHCDHDLCHCLHLYRLNLGDVVDLVLVDEGGPLNQGQTVHLHGHSFRVLGQGVLPPAQRGQLRAMVKEMDEQSLLERNLDHPIEKDTVMIPRGGYTVVRFKAENPGYWLLHSQVLFHWWAGMAVVLQVGDPSDFPSPPSDFPLCSS